MKEDFPLVSLVVFTYNHKPFIKETLEGALSQDYPNLEIVISDDCSPDGTFELLECLAKDYSGPHSLTIRKNKNNLGLVEHVNKLLSEFAHGEYVMLSGGDDVCLPTTVSFAVKSLMSADVDSMAFNTYVIDSQSNKTGLFYSEKTNGIEIYSLSDYISGRYKSTGCCRLFKREIFDTFGSFSPDCQTEDSTNLLRTFLYGKVGFCYSPNILYRQHGNNLSSFESLMTKINPQMIYEQYRRDIDFALKDEMIDKAEFNALVVIQDEYLRKNIAIRNVCKKKFLISRLICAASYLFKLEFNVKYVKELLVLSLRVRNKND